MKYVVRTNKADDRITNVSEAEAEIVPAGISRERVRSFTASIFLSAYLLNAMAAVRAKTMRRITLTNKKLFHSVKLLKCKAPPWEGLGEAFTPRKKPITAKGSAKMV